MNSYRRIKLGLEAVAHVRTTLQQGGVIAARLLAALDLDRGTVLAYLPSELTDEQAMRFSEGTAPSAPMVEVAPASGLYGRNWIGVRKQNINNTLANIIHRFLTKHITSVCIFEDHLHSISDQALMNSRTRFGEFDHMVYHYLCHPDTDIELVKRTITGSRSWIMIGIMTSDPHRLGLCNDTPLNESVVDDLVSRTQHVIVGAYDGEGFLIWQRSR